MALRHQAGHVPRLPHTIVQPRQDTTVRFQLPSGSGWWVKSLEPRSRAGRFAPGGASGTQGKRETKRVRAVKGCHSPQAFVPIRQLPITG